MEDAIAFVGKSFDTYISILKGIPDILITHKSKDRLTESLIVTRP